ncbi:DNA cytosine methyltransferase [Planomicrobium okeanokoites]|uniref:Cytosine-specific methyltransferase n=1 Tax=Planomicrobium okeanokoites TaxID=244 RepID=A0ABV7KRZ3_PLAOK|nr:DNA cytosine methyltransferase [Planomicrobium okeanokoites]TAA70030.1 DNA cytosine methyltransferase [Planomicrobium okeanokoites]
MKKYNTIDIFAGCGGLTEGFKRTNSYNVIAAVEWEKAPAANLVKRLEGKWNYEDAEERVLRFDLQQTDELFNGWHDDEKYGSHRGLDYLVDNQEIDVIIGGPPCQAYSLAGRVRDKDGMINDYRNYLFESYLRVVKKYKPKAFIFENVPGMFSAKPGGKLVTDLIRAEIEDAGYVIVDDLKKHALIDVTEYGIPQKRNRVIILALSKDYYLNPQIVLHEFYESILPSYKERRQTVKDAIYDLPKLYPAVQDYKFEGKMYSHHINNNRVFNHQPRYHSKRDIEIFKELALDIENKIYKYASSESLKMLYTLKTGKSSNIHKYHVLKWDSPSNTIPAHLYKDGLRHIHPDSSQARSITVREAARLQTFDDDYEFISNIGDNYKMIGNAVPPKLAEKLAFALKEILSPVYQVKKTSSNDLLTFF